MNLKAKLDDYIEPAFAVALVVFFAIFMLLSVRYWDWDKNPEGGFGGGVVYGVLFGGK